MDKGSIRTFNGASSLSQHSFPQWKHKHVLQAKVRVHTLLTSFELFDLCERMEERASSERPDGNADGAAASELHKYTQRLKESTRRGKTNELRRALKVRPGGFWDL